MIDLKEYLTASGAYPDREKNKELTQEYLDNAVRLLKAVNACLVECGIDTTKIKVSSGFRPSAVNAQIANAAKKSLHTRCLAVDILDDSKQSIAEILKGKPDVLKKYELWLENPDFTKGKNTNWVHLDLGVRTDRKNRIFNP
jgi:hypothetical protein